MSELKKWIWPAAAAGGMGIVVAFGLGLGVGGRLFGFGFGAKSQPQQAAVVDASTFRPMVHEEVQSAVTDALVHTQSRTTDAPPVNVIKRDNRQTEAQVAASVRKESKSTEASPTTSARKRSESSASNAAKAAALVSMIHTLRTQMAKYKTDHFDRYPTFAQLQDNWAALTQRTNSDGSLAGGTRGVLGPYIQSAPINPLTGNSELAPAGMPSLNCGWTYDEKTGRIRAFVPAGNAAGEFVADAFVERGGRHIIQTASASSGQ